MAGSGKTTLLQRLSSHLHTTQTPGYIINLDPAVTQVPYGANIDIRDTVHFTQVEVMQAQFALNCAACKDKGNSGILACPGELQERDETVWSGSKWWHLDISQSFCDQVRSGVLSSQARIVTSSSCEYISGGFHQSCTTWPPCHPHCQHHLQQESHESVGRCL